MYSNRSRLNPTKQHHRIDCVLLNCDTVQCGKLVYCMGSYRLLGETYRLCPPQICRQLSVEQLWSPLTRVHGVKALKAKIWTSTSVISRNAVVHYLPRTLHNFSFFSRNAVLFPKSDTPLPSSHTPLCLRILNQLSPVRILHPTCKILWLVRWKPEYLNQKRRPFLGYGTVNAMLA